MMTLLSLIMLTASYLTAQSLNPVKTSIFLLLLSTTMFIFMNLKKGLSWFPMMFYLLFMGGILIVFMIMSSILPNEKTLKMKNMNIMIMLILSFMFQMNKGKMESTTQITYQLKWFFQESMNLIFVMFMITLYFFLFILLISEEKSSMRTETC